MRALLVTSRLTFVPANHLLFLQEVLDVAGEHIAGLALLPGGPLGRLSGVAHLFRVGARRMAAALLVNTVALIGRRRESLFAQRGIPVLGFDSANSAEMLAWVNAQRIDLIVNARTRELYREPILRAPAMGCVNVHHGLLPEERGDFCDLFALAEDRPAGFSIHVMTEKQNDGPILLKRTVAEPGEKDYLALVRRSSRMEGWALGELILDVARRKALPEGEPNRPQRPIHRRFRATREEVLWLQQRKVRL